MRIAPSLATALLLCAAAVPLTLAYSIQQEEDEASIDAFGSGPPRMQLVGSTQELLSILTPVYPDEHTLSLLRNQLRTFAAFTDVGSFAAWIMVTPAGKLASLQMFLDFELTMLPAAVSDKIVLVTDEVCAPELEPSRFALIAFNDAVFIPGWFKQQLLKLACGHLVTTPFYLITDADTFYLNPFSAGDLFEVSACNSSAHIVCNAQRSEAFRAKTELQPYVNGTQQLWIRNSAETLHLPVPTNTRYSSGVTPQIFARPLVAAVVAHLKALLKEEYWEHMPWRVYLCGRLTQYYYLAHHRGWSKEQTQPWTEYNVYWVFAEHSGLWDAYHVHAQLASWRANAWLAEQFDGWDPCTNTVTDKWNPGYWATFQSAIQIDGRPVPGEAIWAKLAPCVPGAQGTGSESTALAAAAEQQRRRRQWQRRRRRRHLRRLRWWQ